MKPNQSRSRPLPPGKRYPVFVEEKMPLGKKLAVGTFIVIGTLLIIALVILAKPAKTLVCDETPRGANSLTSFGSCHEE